MIGSTLPAVQEPPPPATSGGARFDVLDGWRGISILLVMATHMLPLGPKVWQLNDTTGPLGMSLFFPLSGFLITTTLIKHGQVMDFFIRRLFRILPLAFLYLLAVLPFVAADGAAWLAHATFTVNYLPDCFDPLTLHFWSLCVEIHFYVVIGVLFALWQRRGLVLLPLLLVGITVAKLVAPPTVIDAMMLTHWRVDEILGGCVLSLIYHEERLAGLRRWLANLPLAIPGLVLVASCHPALSVLQCLRPYAAIALMGCTLFGCGGWAIPLLRSRALRYVAGISYALYVIHPATMAGWLGSGSGWEKYLKRPISFALSFGLAHLSTQQFEQRFIGVGKQLVAWRERQRQTVPRPSPA